MRLLMKIQICLLLGFLLTAISVNGQTNSGRPSLTAEKWREDLRFMAEQMPKQHPNIYRRMPKADFDAAVKTLNDRIPSASQDEILAGFMRIVAMVKDGHTGFFPMSYFNGGVIQLRFYKFEDGLYVQRASQAYRDLVGAKVVRIGKLTADEALKQAGTVAGADNEMGVIENAALFLSIPEILRGLGVIDPGQDPTVVFEIEHKERIVTFKPTGSVNELVHPPTDWADSAGSTALYLKHPDDLYWFEYLKDQKILYVQQNAVTNKPDETVAKFYERVMDFVAANPVEKLVIDVRRNDGGNNGLNRPVVIGLIKSKIDEHGKLFVITGRMTFSAAQNFVNEIEKYTNATFVGEPTAGRPNHYGDGRPFTLPNSHLSVQVSTLYWQDMDPRDNRKWTAPEIAATLTSADYKGGKDPALDAIINYRPSSSLQGIIDSTRNDKDVANFVREYDAFKSDPRHRYVETEATLNRIGYALLQQKRVDDAVQIFKLNARDFPNSANAFDSLGDGYAAAGRRDDAIKAYEQALSIDPNFASSADSLRKLKGN
ncbi:MAG: tetratricopeptide repeat protein [Acidobacteriota bacterium]